MRGRFKSPVTYEPAYSRNVASLRGGIKGAQTPKDIKPKLLAEGGTMAKKPFPFEKSKKDVEMKGKGKEGSKKEEAFDKKQAAKGKSFPMKKGGKC